MKRILAALSALLAVFATGCHAPRVLKVERDAAAGVVAQAADERLAVRIDAVVYQNGPGSWASNAYWDEYRLHLANRSSAPLVLESVTLSDAIGGQSEAATQRRRLARASKQSLKRQEQAGVRVKVGAPPGSLLFGGGALAAGGAAMASSAAAVGVMGYSGSATVAAVGVGAAMGGFALVGVGVHRAVHNHRIQDRLTERALAAETALQAQAGQTASVFFPITPQPQRLIVRYRDSAGTRHELVVPVAAQLAGLHAAESRSVGTR